MAEERRRGFFNRLFGGEPEPEGSPRSPSEPETSSPPPPSPASTEPARMEQNADGSATGTIMADGLPVPEIPPPDDEVALREALAAALPQVLEQLRTESVITPPPPSPAPVEDTPRRSWFERLRSGLSRSSQSLTTGISDIFTKGVLDQQSLEELEDMLLQVDLGVPTAERITEALAEARVSHNVTMDEVRDVIAREVEKELTPVARPLQVDAGQKPFVILMVGVNGTGKTTTLGKLAARFRQDGRTVLMAAGDTFRAAAIEQLKIWGERARVPVISRPPGTDAAGLAFDAMIEARKAGTDILMIDTAGRLQNKAELMAELAKVIRVIRKHDPSAPHSVLLTLDATTGQNALNQVEVFRDQAGVTGLVMTKLDGTARGGILVAIAAKTGLPVHFIGVGEAIEDLSPFSARDFARAIAGIA
jgi:fused signal recognition particle receptor